MTSDEIVKYLIKVHEYCKNIGHPRVVFELVFRLIGEPLSCSNISTPSSRRSVAFTPDELTRVLFDRSMDSYIVDIHVEMAVNMMSLKISLVESPDHGTNITADIIELFNKMFEL